tara:strand:- start:9948 stop:10751 length:804 start_codon:yes stop_codon:yes gene_type:complete
MEKISHYFIIIIFLISMVGCSAIKVNKIRDSAPSGYPDLSHVPNATPKVEPIAKANQRSYKIFGKYYKPMKSSKGYSETGIASWYGKKFHGNKTANGEIYDMYAMTAAHKLLPLPTYVEIENLTNGKIIVVRVNDRGPFHGNRIIDLSYAAASKIGMLKKGTALVRVKAIDPNEATYIGEIKPLKDRIESEAYDKLMFIQLGAFQNPMNALNLQEAVRSKLNIHVFIESQDQKHRVKIGPIKSVTKKNKIVQSLIRMGIENTKILYQ